MAYEQTKDLKSKIKAEDPELYKAINKYIDDLKKEAKGDYNFVVKFLKRQFETALGTDDAALASFYSQVANTLEERIGRIPYDYELMTGREKEDLALYLDQQDKADTRQREQEAEFEAQQQLAGDKEQREIRESASERGMLDSGIEKRQAEEARQEREVNVINPQRSMFAYQQALRDMDRSSAVLQSGRNIEDLTTTARRGAQDSQYSYDYGVGRADLSLAQRLAEIDREKRLEFESGAQQIEQQKINEATLADTNYFG